MCLCTIRWRQAVGQQVDRQTDRQAGRQQRKLLVCILYNTIVCICSSCTTLVSCSQTTAKVCTSVLQFQMQMVTVTLFICFHFVLYSNVD